MRETSIRAEVVSGTRPPPLATQNCASGGNTTCQEHRVGVHQRIPLNRLWQRRPDCDLLPVRRPRFLGSPQRHARPNTFGGTEISLTGHLAAFAKTFTRRLHDDSRSAVREHSPDK